MAYVARPNLTEEVQAREEVPPEPDASAEPVEVTVASFVLPDGEPRIERDPSDPNRYRVVAPVPPGGLDLDPEDRRIPVTRLSVDDVAALDQADEGEGFRPPAATLRFAPRMIEPMQPSLSPDGEPTPDGLDRGGTIWGSDDRTIFFDQNFPWRTTGLIETEGHRCSGATIGPRHVLTASHCINWGASDEDPAGWVRFTPASFDGSAPFGQFAATQVIYWNKARDLLSDLETAFDYVVLVMDGRVGDVVGYPGYRAFSTDWLGGAFWQFIGYPGEIDSGQRPAFQSNAVVSTADSESLSGQDAFVLGHFNEFTPGQSGGPVWGWWADEPWPRVVGVGSTIGSTAVRQPPGDTSNDNEYGGGSALSALITWARENHP